MNDRAMQPYGCALRAFWEGDKDAELTMIRDDGREERVPVQVFFREPGDFSTIDKKAIELCKGHVLDVGAGTGVHSLVLQKKGFRVTAIDVCTEAVAIMVQRGVVNARCTDVLEFNGGPFDTILMMGHGIGMVETIEGLDRFLAIAAGLITRGGQILLDSMDVRLTSDLNNLAYQEANRRSGHYVGEIRLLFAHQETRGPYCGWLHLDAETLEKHAEQAGWKSDLVLQQDAVNYLARLTRIA